MAFLPDKKQGYLPFHGIVTHRSAKQLKYNLVYVFTILFIQTGFSFCQRIGEIFARKAAELGKPVSVFAGQRMR
jgi:lauroyl/myristoyl acyltransferase